MDDVRLEVVDLVKSHGAQKVLDGVSLRVSGGEFVAVLGPSGAGKTTLFRCIAGLTTQTSGHVVLSSMGGSPLRGRDRRRIAVVFQQFNLIARRSALANVLAGRLGHVDAWRGMLSRFPRNDVLWALECLDRVGLIDMAERRADTLSGGQQQRVAIARAIAQRPEVIIADEPVASLDPQTSLDVLGLLRSACRDDGVAVLCSLHQVDLARTCADRIVGLSAGRVVADLTAEAFDAQAAARVYGAMRDEVMPG